MNQLATSPVLISGNSVHPASVVRGLESVWILNVDARHGRLRCSF